MIMVIKQYKDATQSLNIFFNMKYVQITLGWKNSKKKKNQKTTQDAFR
jgi:hypothetical protein